MTPALLALAVAAGPAGDRFREGVAARADAGTARRAFAAAAAEYDRAWQTVEARTPAVAVNRGRAHFLAGNLPMAVRAFRDGLDLAPADRRLQHGLLTCRAAVAYPAETDPAGRVRPDPPAGLRHRVSPWDLFAAASLFAVVTTAGLARRLTTGDGWATPAAAAGLAGLGLVAGVGWAIDRAARRDRARPVAVVAADAVLRTGNGPTYPPRVDAPLPRGAEVRQLGRRGGWAHVELPGGAAGWLPEAAVLTGADRD